MRIISLDLQNIKYLQSNHSRFGYLTGYKTYPKLLQFRLNLYLFIDLFFAKKNITKEMTTKIENLFQPLQ